MIQQLSNKYHKLTAATLLTIFCNSILLPLHAAHRFTNTFKPVHKTNYSVAKSNYAPIVEAKLPYINKNGSEENKLNTSSLHKNKANVIQKSVYGSPVIGGPSQPEMSAFKSVGTDNMVNLFTGDFSYNIPLLDVGGYPVNIFYDGGVSMEQEASWVGLGWNINPGNVNRNMRGIPDDFNGEDILTQKQNLKPNLTWGVNLGVDLEVVGIKNFKAFSGSLGTSLGVNFNNYLGPALDIGIKGSTGLQIAKLGKAEKSALTLGGALSINASSRSGVSFSPSLSLTAKANNTANNSSVGFGVRAGTSYNSRTGIKAIQISEQMSFNNDSHKYGKDANGTRGSQGNSISETLSSQSITFNKPSYVPTMRMPMTNSAFSGHFQLGGAIFGVYPSFEVEVFKQKSEVAPEDIEQKKPMVGYLYMQNAVSNSNAVMDFTRVNDNEVTPTTPIISAPQYSFDVFSIQGEGTGGSIRAYRNDDGFVRDNYSISKDKNISVGADVGIPGHYGANFNKIKTPSTIGEWKSGNKLKSLKGFTVADGSFENVYFRNPGENSVINPNQYDRIGGADLVRYKIAGGDLSPTLEPKLEKFSKSGNANGLVDIASIVPMTERKKRTQVISFLNAKEASEVGLDKEIKNYDGVTVLNGLNNLNFQALPRIDGFRKKHHISQINVTEASGQRYVYGIPVYNLIQKDFTFTTESTTLNDAEEDKVNFSVLEPYDLNSNSSKDGYLNTTITPAYAHSFLLSGLLSPDYVDVKGDGITEDDLGNAVKFNYSKMGGASKWRTPLSSSLTANFNAGKRTEIKDDKGIVSYGERESWYAHSIESKTMIALFKLESRNDGKGSLNDVFGINGSDNSAQRLKEINLYSKADLKKNGIAGAKPIKTVHFEYSYALCKGTPNNTTAAQGKLTLDNIYFTYNGKNRANKNKYVFSYGSTTAENPDYEFNANDRWGTYKPRTSNPASLKNADYPYSLQDINQKATIDQNAGAWMLKKILLPSGGQMEVNYESDDYAFVQNKKAADMLQVVGFGSTVSSYSNQLYNINGGGFTENNYVFVQVPEACTSNTDVYNKYLDGIKQLSFKLSVMMPKGMEFLNSYATIDGGNYGIYTNDATNKTIWIKLNNVDGISPLSLTAIEFLREQLPGQAFAGYDVSETTGLAQVADMLAGLFEGLKGAFKDPIKSLRQAGKAQSVNISKCFVRLNDADGFKYGGGYRVKSIKLKDNWKEMNSGQLYTSEYGQDYDYTTKEIFNGVERTISSGVASYEPSLGGDENPFQTMVQISNKVPLGPTSYGAVEMPVLDAFFPSASVGYSKVTVKSIKKGPQDPSKKSRSGIGKQVSEYYTAKDFPVYYSNTSFDPSSDKQGSASTFAFFYKYAIDTRSLSQGFLVETNDMHGKMKSQSSYPENDDKTPINFTQNFYRNTGSNGFAEKFDFVNAAQSGAIKEGNMGIDIELLTDTREFSVKSNSIEVQGQLDLFPVILPFWLPFIWPVVGNSENTYRAVTATKVVTYHSILDSVLVIDKGSVVSTKNLVFDAETGDVIVNRTNNEFKQAIYSTNYPAWWAYSGMGPAYKNIDFVYTANFRDGVINIPTTNFESGDELYLLDPGSYSSDPCGASFNNAAADVLWAFDTNKNNSSLTNPNPTFLFMDKEGKLYSKNNVRFRIIRSGKRNMLSAKAGSVVTMKSPILEISPTNRKLNIDANSNTINASAVEFKEKWQNDNDVFKKYNLFYPPPIPQGSNLVNNGNFEQGNVGFGTNYRYIQPGSWQWGGNGSNGGYFKYTVSNGICSDHTTGNGNKMAVDGIHISTASNVLWQQNVAITPFTAYNFSMWALLQNPGAPPNLKIEINGIQVGNAFGGVNWQQFQVDWNSGFNYSANIVIRNLTVASGGNDFAIDDISLTSLPVNSCTPNELQDCSGYLEKKINPYRKGLLGNFKTYQSKVFYDSRGSTTENNLSTPINTNLPVNGFLNNFKLYWDFNNLNNLVPDFASTQWIWNSQITKVNAKGLELETKDALGIYTAAQYGYNKTMPVAIANNSRSNEMFAENFEDYGYEESINTGVSYNSCSKKFVDFDGLDNSSIIPMANPNLNSHSGKKSLLLNLNSYSVKTIPIESNNANNFNLLTTSAITADVIDNGVTITGSTRFPLYSNISITQNTPANGLAFSVYQYNPQTICGPGQWGGYNRSHSFSINSTHYIKIVNCGANPYNFKEYNNYGNMSFRIFTLDDVEITKTYTGANNTGTEKYYSCILRNGIYKINTIVNGGGSQDCPYPQYSYICDMEEAKTKNNNLSDSIKSNLSSDSSKMDNQRLPCCSAPCTTSPGYLETHHYTVSITNEVVPAYKSLDLVNGCSFTKPIAASNEMINPTFTLTPGKKMLFSGWVRENCIAPPCIPQNYTSSKVELDFGGAAATVTLLPTGNIIEGWQKVEGDFTVPANATSMNMRLINNSSSPNYWDDIRIQPYNANMKSYVYDPVNLRLLAELDANNYASFYEYDAEGTLIRTKVETREGIKTVTETRSAKQKNITTVQP